MDKFIGVGFVLSKIGLGCMRWVGIGLDVSRGGGQTYFFFNKTSIYLTKNLEDIFISNVFIKN